MRNVQRPTSNFERSTLEVERWTFRWFQGSIDLQNWTHVRTMNRRSRSEEALDTSAFCILPSAFLSPCSGFAGDALRERLHANHLPLMQTARNHFLLIAGLHLEGSLRAFHLDHAGRASNALSDRCGREVTYFDLDAHGPFVGLQQRQ